jgi:hypothetical protein
LVEKTENRETEINKTNEPCKGGYGGQTGHFLGGSFANKIIWTEAQIHSFTAQASWQSGLLNLSVHECVGACVRA